MDTQLLFDKTELTELTNKLFVYTDNRNGQKLQDEVFTENVWFGMQSAGGGEPTTKRAEEICTMWQTGFNGLDAVHHQAGHYLIAVNGDDATVYGYAVATHYKAAAKNGKVRTFVGSYELKAARTEKGWRLTSFKYNLKYINGNTSLQ